jgi:hypothetical protein
MPRNDEISTQVSGAYLLVNSDGQAEMSLGAMDGMNANSGSVYFSGSPRGLCGSPW